MRTPRWGIEFDWLGADRRGHVAVFASAGYGAGSAHPGVTADHEVLDTTRVGPDDDEAEMTAAHVPLPIGRLQPELG